MLIIQVRRSIAVLIDMMIIGLVLILFSFLMVLGIDNKYITTKYILLFNHSFLFQLILLTICSTIYYMVFELRQKSSIGKRLMNLKTIKYSGGNISIINSLIRNLFRITDQFLIIGSIFILLNKDCRRLGDLLSNTKVISTIEKK